MNDCICTVLLIAYNHKQYVRMAIESVIMQKTEYQFKIHIFDDASTDGTSDIVREYAERYPDLIVPFIAEQNQGSQVSIWNAYKSVDTKYCAVLECDDYWCAEEKLQMQIDALEQHPDCSFCAHNTLFENINDPYRRKEGGKLLVFNRNVRKTGKYTSEDFNVLYGAGWMNHCNSRLIRMSCVDLDALSDKEDFLYDNCQFFYLLFRGDIYFIHRVMSVYNMNMASSFTSLQVQKKISGHFSRMIHIDKSTNGIYERLIYRHLGSFARYWLALDDIEQGIIKEHSDLTYIILREIRKLIYDLRQNYKLKIPVKKTIRKLQRKIEQ